jgi:endo-alpha-1,4-polygalactosaminidase (GH114 family)
MSRVTFTLIGLVLAIPAWTANFRSHITHYGGWNQSAIASFQRFDLVVLQAGNFDPAQDEIRAIAELKSKGTKVLLYLSIGEDASTYNHGKPATGDGRGPVHWNKATASLVFSNKGIASYYLDEWNAQGPGDSVNQIPDGIPDRQGDWGSCLVHAGDSEWQSLILKESARLMGLGADGLFLDTPETANPWSGYGWTSEGMYHLIRKIREAHPSSYLILNRGLFFFDPDYALQYRWSPRALLNGVLFESYYTGSNYTLEQGGNGQWRASPYFASNKAISAPRLNAEMNRPDSRGTVFHIDYFANPNDVQKDFPDVFQKIQLETILEQGWIPQVNDRMLSQVPTVFLDNPAPPDRIPPAWRNTAAIGDMETPAPPRIGVLKAIPGQGKVTLRWDVASDQTWPVRYTVYYSTQSPIDFNSSPRLIDVKTEVGADYLDRAGTGGEDGCPYEFTVTGLTNQTRYYFAVRAEDATQSATPLTGRIGPSGGIEEENTNTLIAIPRDSTLFPIQVDGAPGDWAGLPGIPDSMGDGSGSDFTLLSATDDADWLYLKLQFAGTANASQAIVLFNSDRRGITGDLQTESSGYHGADYKWQNGVLYQYQDWDWIRLTANTNFKAAGTHLEIQIAKTHLNLESRTGLDILVKTNDGKEILPDRGLTGFSYTLTQPKVSALPLQFAKHPSPHPLRIEPLSAGLRIRFQNPERQAKISVFNLAGKMLVHRKDWPGDFFDVETKPHANSTVVLRVHAKGLLPVSRLWTAAECR